MLGVYFGCLFSLYFPNPLHSAFSLSVTERVPRPAQLVTFLCSLQLLFKACSFQGKKKIVKRQYGLKLILFSKQIVFKKREDGTGLGENFPEFAFLNSLSVQYTAIANTLFLAIFFFYSRDVEQTAHLYIGCCQSFFLSGKLGGYKGKNLVFIGCFGFVFKHNVKILVSLFLLFSFPHSFGNNSR